MKKVLIVDDEPAIVEILLEEVGALGYDAIGANSGAEALALLKSQTFALIISDVRMPNMSGSDLLAKIRASGAETPFLFITGFADLTEAMVIAAGASGIEHKPIDFESLVRRIKALAGPA